MQAFLEQHGWDIASSIEGDASLRRYFRVHKSAQTGLLMDCSAEAPGTLKNYIEIAEWLNNQGLKAPQIYEAEESIGLAIIEDFGDTSFKQALEQGESEETLYKLAVSVLEVFRKTECDLRLPKYYESPIHEGRRRLIDWYVPAMRGRANEPELVYEYLKIWDEIEHELPRPAMGFVHADYHVENLLFLPNERGEEQAGIIDFQDALYGPLAYDVANILEDARRDVSPELRDFILSYYDEYFKLWVRVLGTQFHSRVIGQFIKLGVAGKTQYLSHMPRLHNYMREGLAHPLLEPLQSFLKENGVDFENDAPEIDLDQFKPLISEDAF